MVGHSGSGQPAPPPPAACDLCYARKVKCDRGNPCENCITAKAQCIRMRPMRVPRFKSSPSDQGMRCVIERLSQLQDSITRVTSSATSRDSGPRSISPSSGPAGPAPASHLVVPSPSPPSVPGTTVTPAVIPDNDDDAPRQVKRPRNGDGGFTSSANSPGAAAAEQTPQCPATSEARSFILRELTSGADLGVSRRVTLESALSLVSQMSQSAGAINEPLDDDHDSKRPLESIEPVPVALLYTMVNDAATTLPRRAHTYEYTFWISPSTLDRMGLALLEKKCTSQTLAQYTVCVHYKAYLFLSSLANSHQSPSLQKHMQRQSEVHLKNSLAALNHVSVTATPSLSLVQALLAGVSLLQHHGETARAWHLVAQACTVCKCLGWHLPGAFTFDPKNADEADILATILMCYSLDKSLSMNLGRPINLPGMEFLTHAPIYGLVRDSFCVIIEGLFVFARVQETIMEKLQSRMRNNGETKRTMIVQSLKQQLLAHNTNMAKARSRLVVDEDKPLEREFFMADFVYHSVLTAVLRHDPRISKDANVREECLSSAREALLCMKNVEKNLGAPEDSLDLYATFIAWTLMIFPLSPYLVLFCNVVATSNHQDFQLMQDIVAILARIKDAKPSIARLHKLCSTFISLCMPLVGEKVQNTSRPNPTQPFLIKNVISDLVNSSSNSGAPRGPVPSTVVSQTAAPLANNSFPTMQTEHGSWTQAVPGMEATHSAGSTASSGEVESMWNNEIMWQLLQAQPSMGWLDNEISSVENEFE